MPSAKKIRIKNVLQICVVVRDLQKAIETYWNIFGIGPWHIVTLQPPSLKNTTIRGKQAEYSMKLALAQVGDIQWELVQPLTGPSIYMEFLDQKGEGLHHVAFDLGNYDQALKSLEQHGVGILMSGEVNGETFTYMDTEKLLGAIIEIYKRPASSTMPPPESLYPPSV